MDEQTQATQPVRNLAKIGRFDGVAHEVGFNDGDTIQVLMNKAGLSYGSGETISDNNGNTIALTDRAMPNETYWVVGNYKQG